MGKISIQELATALAEYSSLNKKESSAFVSAMFDIIQEALERDRNVKIKGLGTFKIIDVEDRESVNVNTGERVLIEGHGKITFTPDPLMKELVNKPFSQFETVVLNDGVEFNETPEEVVEEIAILPDFKAKSEPEPEPVAEPEPEPVVEAASEPEPEPNAAPEPAAEPEPESVIEAVSEPEPEIEPSAMPLVDFGQTDDEEEFSDEDIPEWVIEPMPAAEKPVEAQPVEEETIVEHPVVEPPTEEDSVAKEEPVVEEPIEEQQPIEEQLVEEEPAVEQPVANESVEEQSTTEDAPEEEPVEDSTEEEPAKVEPVEDESVDEEEYEEETTSSSKKWIWASLLALLLGLAGGYVFGNFFPFSTFQSILPPKNPEVKETPAPVVKESPKEELPAVEEMEPVVEQPQPEAEKKDEPEVKSEAKSDKSEAKPEKQEAKPEPKPETKSDGGDIHAIYAAKDIRVRTGAYRIIGTQKVVKAKGGETVLKISNRNLGPGMECYVEAYNDIKASTVLKEGQEIKIPELKLKKKKKTE